VLVALKELRLEGALPVTGPLPRRNSCATRARLRDEFAFVRSVAVPAALLCLLARGRAAVLSHLCLEQLTRQRLGQHLHAALAKKYRLDLLF
jgi:hypothetical protein